MPTVLIVDQNANIRRLMRQVLERTGYGVVEATTAAQVYERLAAELPAVIILDCLLAGPGLGIHLLRELHTTPATRGIPVVITTGIAAGADTRLAKCGASGLLAKPFAPRDLVRAVACALAVTRHAELAAAAHAG